MTSKHLPWFNRFFATVQKELNAWCDNWAQQDCVYAPKELGFLARYTSSELSRKFPPGKTHQSQVRDELGPPDLTIMHHQSGKTIWHYRILEYWVCHAPVNAGLHQVRQHELYFAFEMHGLLKEVERACC